MIRTILLDYLIICIACFIIAAGSVIIAKKNVINNYKFIYGEDFQENYISVIYFLSIFVESFIPFLNIIRTYYYVRFSLDDINSKYIQTRKQYYEILHEKNAIRVVANDGSLDITLTELSKKDLFNSVKDMYDLETDEEVIKLFEEKGCKIQFLDNNEE